MQSSTRDSVTDSLVKSWKGKNANKSGAKSISSNSRLYYASIIPPSPEPTLPIPTFEKHNGIDSGKTKRNDTSNSGNNGITIELETAIQRAEQRGGSISQIQTNTLPLWMCHRQHVFSLPPSAVISGTWCELCPESLGERAARVYLEKLGLDYRSETKFPSLAVKGMLRFDFYIPALKWIIEIDGEQHFGSCHFKGSKKEPLLVRLLHDQMKDDWCIREGFSLLRIPYWQLAETETVIDNVYRRLLNGEKNVYICDCSEWRKRAISALQQKKRAPKAPIPVDAKQRTLDARQERRDDISRDVDVTNAMLSVPSGIEITIE